MQGPSPFLRGVRRLAAGAASRVLRPLVLPVLAPLRRFMLREVMEQSRRQNELIHALFAELRADLLRREDRSLSETRRLAEEIQRVMLSLALDLSSRGAEASALQHVAGRPGSPAHGDFLESPPVAENGVLPHQQGAP
jgi:hypothetical protein